MKGFGCLWSNCCCCGSTRMFGDQCSTPPGTKWGYFVNHGDCRFLEKNPARRRTLNDFAIKGERVDDYVCKHSQCRHSVDAHVGDNWWIFVVSPSSLSILWFFHRLGKYI